MRLLWKMAGQLRPLDGKGTTRPTTDSVRGEAIAHLVSRGLDLSSPEARRFCRSSGAMGLSFFLEERYTLLLLIR